MWRKYKKFKCANDKALSKIKWKQEENSALKRSCEWAGKESNKNEIKMNGCVEMKRSNKKLKSCVLSYEQDKKVA